MTPDPPPGNTGPTCLESCVITYRAQCDLAYIVWLASDRGTAATATYTQALATALNNLTACIAACPEA